MTSPSGSVAFSIRSASRQASPPSPTKKRGDCSVVLHLEANASREPNRGARSTSTGDTLIGAEPTGDARTRLTSASPVCVDTGKRSGHRGCKTYSAILAERWSGRANAHDVVPRKLDRTLDDVSINVDGARKVWTERRQPECDDRPKVGAERTAGSCHAKSGSHGRSRAVCHAHAQAGGSGPSPLGGPCEVNYRRLQGGSGPTRKGDDDHSPPVFDTGRPRGDMLQGQSRMRTWPQTVLQWSRARYRQPTLTQRWSGPRETPTTTGEQNLGPDHG